ncbi:MAG: acyl-CoA/acyl-ACP dehydrogenase [Gammaproteobacteria bacterium]|jgi:alkylation response protein AidB-like acyl-CoA dehydrogenase|nr:acyl-CoA/acyl-ACP dehydrogenase [Gammaproteobacteria bacterium]
MDFQLTEEQQMIVDSLAKYANNELESIAREYRDLLIPKEKMRKLQQRLLDFGVGVGVVSEELGGMGLDAVTMGLLQFEVAKVSPDIAITSLIQLTVGKLLPLVPDHLKEQYVGPVLAGEKLGCVGMSEPGAGSQVTAVNCRAKLDGDDYVINGEKMWISSGDYSDFIFLLARFNDDPVGGLGLILVDREHGYETSNIEKMGLNSQSTAQVFFQDVRVPASNLMVEPGKAMKTLLTMLASSRPIVGLMALAIAEASLEQAVQYSKDRTQFGKPIAGHQLICAKLGEMATKVQAGKLMSFRALSAIDNGERSDVHSAMAKWFGTEVACEVVGEAMQIHGGNGITKEFPIEYMYRSVRPFMVTEGTNEIQKLAIGRSLTGIDAY